MGLFLVRAAKAIIDYFRPPFWTLENVSSARKFLTPILGPVRVRVPGHVLWGNVPALFPQCKAHKWKLPPTPDRSALRAKIPYEIGESICRTVEARS